MRRLQRAGLFGGLIGVLLTAPFIPSGYSQKGKPFQPGCTLPFEEIKNAKLPIDKQCGKLGDSADPLNQLQSTFKNNFCAVGDPVRINFSTFDSLQTAAEQKKVPFGRKTLPNGKSVEMLPDKTQRESLKGIFTDPSGNKIGEGSVVTLEGFVFKAQHSNTTLLGGAGESVNCHSGTLARNDIHIALASTTSVTNECETVTAEISPHFRPTSWDRFDINPKTKAAAKGLPLEEARVRITGQLFFDASHSPCRKNPNGTFAKVTPARRSIWEIHPVYAIEVFDAKQKKFVSLDEFAKGK